MAHLLAYCRLAPSVSAPPLQHTPLPHHQPLFSLPVVPTSHNPTIHRVFPQVQLSLPRSPDEPSELPDPLLTLAVGQTSASLLAGEVEVVKLQLVRLATTDGLPSTPPLVPGLPPLSASIPAQGTIEVELQGEMDAAPGEASSVGGGRLCGNE